MSIADILSQYATRPTHTEEDFDDVARDATPELLGGGIADAFRSDRTPAFGDMVGNLFGGSNAQQRGGLLGTLVSTLGPAVLSGLAGGGLSRLAEQFKGGLGGGQVQDVDHRDITPEHVREMAAEAEKRDPSILDRVGELYAKNPETVKILGGAALAVILGQMAQRSRR